MFKEVALKLGNCELKNNLLILYLMFIRINMKLIINLCTFKNIFEFMLFMIIIYFIKKFNNVLFLEFIYFTILIHYLNFFSDFL